MTEMELTGASPSIPPTFALLRVGRLPERRRSWRNLSGLLLGSPNGGSNFGIFGGIGSGMPWGPS
jgi:hypothetical protein